MSSILTRVKQFAYKMTAVSLILASSLVLGSCGGNKLPVYTEEVHVTVPGMSGEVKIIYLSDLHIAETSDEITGENLATASTRTAYSSYEGVTAAQQWPGWVDTINSSRADYVLFGADMLDFCSSGNINILKKDIDRLKMPYMYIRADHDITSYFIPGLWEPGCVKLQEEVCEFSDVYVTEFDDFMIIGWNNSTAQLGETGIEKIREACSSGKPLILLTHVPIAPLEDNSLAEASKAVYQDRSLIYSLDDSAFYHPASSGDGAPTAELLSLLYADDSPFIEVLCGHLHFSWDGYISKNVHQHVFSAAFNRYMGVITVSGN